jgi:hypothetical protein
MAEVARFQKKVVCICLSINSLFRHQYINSFRKFLDICTCIYTVEGRLKPVDVC